MIVAELRIVLEHLPDDLEVYVRSDGVAAHVAEIDRRARGRAFVELEEGSRFPKGARTPGAVVLGGGLIRSVGWWLPVPRPELRGSFRRPDELEARLDALELGSGPS